MLASVFSCLLPLRNRPVRESFLVDVQHVDKKSLSDCYDRSRQGVLVLACSPRASSLYQPVPVYCNAALADAVGVDAASKDRTADKVLGVLAATDPDVLHDITQHARQVAASEAGGRVSLYLPTKKYQSTGGYAGSASDCQVASPRQRSVFGRQWLYAVSEPAAYIPDSDAEASTSPKCWPARVKRGGVSTGGTWSADPAEACSWPAVIVTFHVSEGAGSGIHPLSHGAQSNKAWMGSRVKAETSNVTTVSGASGAMANREGTSAAAAFSNGGGGGRGAGAGSLPGGDGRGDPMATIMLTFDDHEEPSTANMFVSTERQIGGAKAAREKTACGAPSREGMALSGLASIVTAFTVDGKEVIYQNAESVECYGPQVAKLGNTAGEGGGAHGGLGILEKIFSLEPSKLERLFEDVCTEGKVWKGIVQVPCPLDLCPPAQRGEGWAHPAAGTEVDASEGPQSTQVTAALRSGSRPATAARARSMAHTQLSQTSAGFSAGEAVGGASGADGTEPGILRTADSALCTSNGGRPRFAKQSSTVSDIAEPLATSTWGLMLELPTPKPRNAASTASQRVTSRGSSCRTPAAAPGGAGTSSSPVTGDEPTLPTATALCSPSWSARASPLVPAPEPSHRAPRVARVYDASIGQRRLHSVSIRPRRRSVQRWTLDEDEASAAAAAGPGEGCAASTAGLQTAAFASLGPGGKTDLAPPRRCVSRTDLSVWAAPRAPASRVVAFASSVRGAPTSVLLGLQMAAASAGGAGNSCGDGSSAFRRSQRPVSAVSSRDGYARLGDSVGAGGLAKRTCSVRDAASGQITTEYGRAAAFETLPARRMLSGLPATSRAEASPPEPAPVPSARTWTAGRFLPSFAATGRRQLPQRTGQDSTPGPTPARDGDPPNAEQRTDMGAGDSSRVLVTIEGLATTAAELEGTAAAGPGSVPGPAGSRHGSSLLVVAQQAQAGSECEGSCCGPCLGYSWHEMCATRQVDPVTGQFAMVLTQTDVTAKVEAERHIALVTEVQHRLLEQIFPRHVLAYMTEEGGPWNAPQRWPAGGDGRQRPMVRDINKLATSHEEVTLLFADIEGFTPMCKALEPRVVMAFLNDLFTRFDNHLDEFGVYKVETIGDCYFVAGGLIQEDDTGTPIVRARRSNADPLHAERVFLFAKAMLAAASQVTLPTNGGPVRMRIGIHSGPVVSGVVGQRMPRFCLFGDTVNTTSRMESTGVAGCIHASDAAHALLAKEAWLPTGGIEVKGKGRMNTYLWAPPDADSRALLARHMASASGRNATHGSGAAASAAAGCGCGNDTIGKAHVSLRPQLASMWKEEEPASSRGGCGDGAQQCGEHGGGGGGGGGSCGNVPPAMRVRQRSVIVPSPAAQGSRAEVTTSSDVTAFSSSNAHGGGGGPVGASALSCPSHDTSVTDSVAALAILLLSKN